MSYSAHYDNARATLVNNAQRADKDFYATPDETTQKILPIVADEIETAIDPFCGDGAILDSLKKFNPKIELFGIELDSARYLQALEKHPNIVYANAFSRASEWKQTLLITNPPFSEAPTAITLATNLGIERVAFFVRCALLTNKSLRKRLMRSKPDIYIVDKVRFAGFDGDFPEMMMWLYFHPRSQGKWTVL